MTCHCRWCLAGVGHHICVCVWGGKGLWPAECMYTHRGECTSVPKCAQVCECPVLSTTAE